MIGKRFRDDPGEIRYIATVASAEMLWLCQVYSTVAIHGIWPGSSRKRFPITQIAFKSSLFAFFCLSDRFHACLNIESKNQNVVDSVAKNHILGLFSTPG